MGIDYVAARESGAAIVLDMNWERVLLTVPADHCGDPSTAEMGDDGVLAIYDVNPEDLLMSLLDALSGVGFDIDHFLRRKANEQRSSNQQTN